MKVLFADGSDADEAAALAKKADVAIVVVGNHPECNAGWDQCPTAFEWEGRCGSQDDCAGGGRTGEEGFAANPKTIEVLRSSFPYAIVWSQQNVPAIVHMTHNSQEEGHGLADVLFGDYSPAGRLTQTWPTGDAQLLPILDYNLLDGETYLYSKEKPLYAFGYGLSYTTFEYRGVGASAVRMERGWQRAGDDQGEEHGQAASDEVVQMYVQHLGSAVTRPQLELKGFRASADRGRCGEGCDDGPLKARDLAYWDAGAHAWRVEKEKVRVLAGGSSDKLPVQTTVEVIDGKDFKP